MRKLRFYHCFFVSIPPDKEKQKNDSFSNKNDREVHKTQIVLRHNNIFCQNKTATFAVEQHL